MHDAVKQLLEERRNSQAFEKLLDLYGNKVFRMGVAILKNPARAEELTQDVFLKLWQALPSYDGRAAVGTWLYAIARNTFLTAARADAYRSTLSLEESPEPQSLVQHPRVVEVAQCVGRLPEIQRQAITLFYFEEKSVEQVAQMLALPSGTVKSHLHRARAALAAMMRE